MGEGWLLPYTLYIIYAGCILSVEAARIVFLRKVQPGVLEAQQGVMLFYRYKGAMGVLWGGGMRFNGPGRGARLRSD